MKKSQLVVLMVLFGMLYSCTQNGKQNKMNQVEALVYPETFRDSTVFDDYHGTKVYDPYRWLEDDHAENTMEWVKSQNERTFEYLEKIPYRNAVKERLTSLMNYERFGTPFKKKGKYYYYKNDGLQNQSVLYVKDSLAGASKVVLDPNGFSEDGTIALSGISFDKEANFLAYLTSEGGSDWKSAQIMKLETGELLADNIEWIKFSGLSWYKDGFFYSRYPEPGDDEELTDKNEYHKLYYHKLGSDQSEDKLWYEDNEHPERNVYASVTEDERFLIISIVESTTGNALSIFDLESENPVEIKLVEGFEKDYNVIDHKGDQLIIKTSSGAPNMRVMLADIHNPAEENWKEIIKEAEEPMKGISIAGNKLFVSYLKNAYSKISIYDLNGKFMEDMNLPGIGSVGGISGEKEDNEAFFTFSSFLMPATIYRLNTDDMEYEIFKKPSIDFKPEEYITEQIWYKSKDGTNIPMFLTYKKGLKKDGTNPTLLYGYGGFDISITPGFRTSRIPLLENGGIFVVANIRGGGEFGEKWHLSGTLDQKQNVFDDFIAAAEFLIEEKYTSSGKLAIQGGSNGGLLVGACMTQRPDLFAVALPAVGVLDMLRYHKFTIGWAWATDYGTSDSAEDFAYLYKYSPLHNLKEQAYPATLVTTADHDDRVVPAHSFKFISELQYKQRGSQPVLIRIETSAGHGAGKPVSKQIEEYADVFSFMFYNLGVSPIYK